MFDPPFPIGHLYKGEQDRIRAGDLNPYEREMLAKNEDPWAKFGTPKQSEMDVPEPNQWLSKTEGWQPGTQQSPTVPDWVNKPDTIHLSLDDEAVAEPSQPAPEDEDDPPFDSQARQHPITPETRKKIEDQGKWGTDWPPQGTVRSIVHPKNLGSADGGAGTSRPDFGNLSESQIRRDRINRAIQSGGQPDPEDLAEEAAEKIRYERKVADAFERKRKELESEPTNGETAKDTMDVDVVQRIKSISRETSDDYHWFETAIRDARLWGIISVIALAIAFSRRSANSDAAVWIFLLLAAVMAVLMVNTLRVVRMSLYRTPITIFSAMCLLPLFALAGYWLTVPVSQSTETRTSSPTPISGQVFVSSPTPATIIQATPLSSPLRSSAPGDNPLLSFDRTILIKGGSVHRLDALMTAAGYKGSLLLQTLYIYNKDEGGAEICWGDQPNVDPTTGGCVPSGDGYNFPGGRDARQVYLMAKKDMRLYISALSR